MLLIHGVSLYTIALLVLQILFMGLRRLRTLWFFQIVLWVLITRYAFLHNFWKVLICYGVGLRLQVVCSKGLWLGDMEICWHFMRFHCMLWLLCSELLVCGSASVLAVDSFTSFQYHDLSLSLIFYLIWSKTITRLVARLCTCFFFLSIMCILKRDRKNK